MSLIVDASVAVKWVTEEENSDRAEELFVADGALVAPELVLAEVGNALWKKFRNGRLEADQAVRAVHRMPAFFGLLVPSFELASAAMRLSTTLDHPIYDCFYLALAEREAAPIVSADRKLLAAAARLGTIEARPL